MEQKQEKSNNFEQKDYNQLEAKIENDNMSAEEQYYPKANEIENNTQILNG